MISSLEAVERTGISYRQLDYWCQRGYIEVEPAGSGRSREISDHEFRVLTWMAKLVNAGLVPEAAARSARKLADGAKLVELGGKFELSVVEG